jgi:DNA-dependent RNA polymerase auxiliary subunit epsilon
MSCCKVGKNYKEKDWKSLGRELGRKWLTVNNLMKEIEGKMRDFQKKGEFNIEFRNKFDSNFSQYEK